MSGIWTQHEKLPFGISTNIDDFDFGRVHRWLSDEAYWSRGLPRDTMEKGFRHSLAFGLFHDTEGQVGCARLITDHATFAYLADVFIDNNSRGLGLGRWLMDVIMVHPDVPGLRRLMLATSNMHPLYAQVGFKALARPEIFMEINRPDIYRHKTASQ